MSVENILKIINREPKSFLITYIFNEYPITSYDAEKKIMEFFSFDPKNREEILLFRKKVPSLSHGSIENFIESSLNYALEEENKRFYIPKDKLFVQDIAAFSLGYSAKEKTSMFDILGANISCYNNARILSFLGANKDVSIIDLISSLNLKWGNKTMYLERLSKHGYITFDKSPINYSAHRFNKTTKINLTEKGLGFLEEALKPIFHYESYHQYFIENRPSFDSAENALEIYLGNMNYKNGDYRKKQIISLLKTRPMTYRLIKKRIGIDNIHRYIHRLRKTRRINVDRSKIPHILSLNA